MNMFGGSVSFLESQFQQRLVQVCLFAAVLFWLLGSYKLIDQVQRVLSKVGLRFGKDSTRVVHALIFAVLLYLLTRFIMDPVVRRLSNGSVVEGQANQSKCAQVMTQCNNAYGAASTNPNSDDYANCILCGGGINGNCAGFGTSNPLNNIPAMGTPPNQSQPITCNPNYLGVLRAPSSQGSGAAPTSGANLVV